MEYKCEICGKIFNNEKDLHAHIKNEHNILLMNYYVKYLPRRNLLTNKLLEYKGGRKKYLNSFFNNKDEMNKWLSTCNKEEGKNFLLSILKNRIEEKKLKYLPLEIELETIESLPETFYFEKFFKNYSELSNLLGIQQSLISENLSLEKINIPQDFEVLIDTREQLPLFFKKSKSQKLAFGDYTSCNKYYNSTYIDRKSESDFKGTMSSGFERFCREIKRVIDTNSFLYVVVETSICKMIKNSKKEKWGKNDCSFHFKRMREIIEKYPNHVQFIFTDNREKSQILIPYLLLYGEKIQKHDVYLTLKRKKFI